MLVHIKLLEELDENMNWDYDKTKIIAHEEIKKYDTFIEFIHSLKKHEAPLIVGDDWYMIEDYALNFPNDSETIPCIYIFVTEYC